MIHSQPGLSLEHNLFRYLDTNGDGTGVKLATGNYRNNPTDFYIQPSPGEIYTIERMLVSIEDSEAFGAGGYGSRRSLQNGITVSTYRGDTQITELTDGIPIKTNSDWGSLAYDTDRNPWRGDHNDFMIIRWTFSKSGQPITLIGALSEKLLIRLNDNFTKLVDHRFHCQGYK